MRTIGVSTRGLSLRALFPQARIVGGSDIEVAACSSDPRRCQPGDLFVALTDDVNDGHDFAGEAVARGAAAVLAEHYLPVSAPQCLTVDSREAHGRLCHALAGSPSDQLHTIGVAGGSGKSSTLHLLRSVFRAAGRDLALAAPRDLAAHDDATPSAPMMAAELARHVDHGAGHVAIEISSRALAQRRLAGVSLDAAILTNFRGGDAAWHNGAHNLYAAQLRVLEHLKPNGFVVVNAADPTSARLLRDLERPALTIGFRGGQGAAHRGEEAEVTARVVSRHVGEQTFLLSAGQETIPVRVPGVGDAHVFNCLAAAAVGLASGLDLVDIVRGLELARTLPGRLERLECGQPFGVFLDVARRPDVLAEHLRALRQVCQGRLLCVLGPEAHGDRRTLPLLARAAERGCDHLALTAGAAAGEAPLKFIHEMLDGVRDPARPRVIPNRAAAITWALEQAREGDVLLLAGQAPRGDAPPGRAGKAGRATQPSDARSDVGGPLSDREVARNWLQARGRRELAAAGAPVILKCPVGRG